MVMQLEERKDGRFSQLVFDGLSGQTGIIDILRAKKVAFKSI